MNLQDLLKLTDFEMEQMLGEISFDASDIKFDTQQIATFEIKGLKYKCEFNVSLTEDRKKILEFKFYLVNNPKSVKRNDFKDDNQYQVALKKSQVGITGTGNSFQVLSSVCTAIKKYVDDNKPDYITFTADEENRQKVYNVILKMATKHISGYAKVDKNPLVGYDLGPEEFWLVKTIGK